MKFIWIKGKLINAANINWAEVVPGGVNVYIGGGAMSLTGKDAERFIAFYRDPERSIDLDRVAALESRGKVA